MHNPADSLRAASLENSHAIVLEPFKLAVVVSLFTHGLCSVFWLYPFGGGTAIRRQKPRLDRIAMESPTGVVDNPLEANIDNAWLETVARKIRGRVEPVLAAVAQLRAAIEAQN